jgi:hypothetical protein
MANVVPSSPILVNVMMEALSSYEKSVLIRATWRIIQEDAILYSHRRENLKSYTYNWLDMKIPFLQISPLRIIRKTLEIHD